MKHWSEEEEVIKSNRPLKILLLLFKIQPAWLVHTICYPVAFFYVIFSARARESARMYQKQLKQFTDGKAPHKISAYRQILSFSLCLLEKMEGWLGKVKPERVEVQEDDIGEVLDRLKQGKSAFMMASHLGNMELMRSLQDYMSKICGRKVPVVIIMDMDMSQNFSQTLKDINPDYSMNVVDAAHFGPDSIIFIQEQSEQGALIVSTADRTSVHNHDKVIRKAFLGKEASFPYGVFLIPALLKLPVYFMFGMRSRMSIFNPKYKLYMEKASVDFAGGRSLKNDGDKSSKGSNRDEKIEKLCGEYVKTLEKFCIKYPYQWYNFFDFWDQ